MRENVNETGKSLHFYLHMHFPYTTQLQMYDMHVCVSSGEEIFKQCYLFGVFVYQSKAFCFNKGKLSCDDNLAVLSLLAGVSQKFDFKKLPPK